MGHYKGYKPILKSKGFCPNPIAVHGIPDYADSSINPSVYGTIAHTDWWNEQVQYCLNGYNTGGIYIPGRYYYYLNFCYISTIGRGNHFPDYVDIDLEFFLLVEEAKRTSKGIICVKKRRVGLSEKWSKGIAGYGLRFTPEKYKAGIVAGLKEYSDELFTKFKEGNSHCPPEFRIQKLFDSDSEFVAGWEDKSPSGWIRAGSQNTVICKTMFQNPNVLKGNLLYDVAFEESGENGVLIAGRNATAKCLEVGQVKVGTEYIYGTGGNIKTGSADFAKMWYEPDSFGLLKIPIYGDRLMISTFIGSVNEKGEVLDNCPNILKKFPVGDGPGQYAYEQLLGMEDCAESIRIIDAEKLRLSKFRDKQAYWNYVQEHPKDDRDAFLKYNSNPFDPDILRTVQDELNAQETSKYMRVLLNWKIDEDENSPNYKQKIYPLQVQWELAPDTLDDDECVLIYRLPEVNYRDLDIAGIDSYDQDQAMTSKSLGAMEVYRRGNNYPHMDSHTPVAIIRQRPRRKEIFYDNCLKLSVMYNLIRNTLVDIDKQLIIDWYKNNGGEIYLAYRPKSIESKDSQQNNLYGVKLTVRSKPIMLGLMQTYVLDYTQNVVFPIWIKEHQDYDVDQTDSDWDLADAHGIALLLDLDKKKKPLYLGEGEAMNDPFDVKVWSSTDRAVSWNDAVAPDVSDDSQGDLFIRLLNQGHYDN